MKIIIAGDYYPRARGKQLIASKKYIGNFKELRDIIKNSDYSIVNFETNIAPEGSTGIDKHGPCLKSDENSLDFLKYLGFNVVTLANNHFYDYGEDGVRNTIDKLRENGIEYVGGGLNLEEAAKTLILHSGNEKLAIINVCEHEFSVADKNKGGSNGIDIIKVYKAIQEAKKSADYILIITHGGHEMLQLPSPRMKEWYRFFIEVGADAVVNHHQHCFSGMEMYHNKPIFYGLGNFFFDDQTLSETKIWNEGFILGIEFTDNAPKHKVYPYFQCKDTADIILRKDDPKFYTEFKRLSEIIQDDSLLETEVNNFFEKSRKSVFGIFEPYFGRYLNAAYFRDLLPSFLTRRKRLAMRNMIECESHCDRLKYLIKD